MQEAKNTGRALVRIGYDGSVHKFFKAARAEERFENELRVLQYLEEKGCEFVPRVLGYDRDQLELVTSNCGARVERMSEDKMQGIFAELESFGVRHDDPFLRNITYRASDGRFCVIDFEFATILDEEEQVSTATRAASDHMVDVSSAEQSSTLMLRWSGVTDRGKYRPNNEDDLLTVAFNQMDFIYLARNGEVPIGDFDYVFAVSDGMGGERSGEFASRFALDNITKLMPRRFRLSPVHNRSGIKDCLRDLFLGIHQQLTLLGETYEEGRSMGATLSMLWYVSGWFYYGHIGDSRIYHIPLGGKMHQLSEDHTHVGYLRRKGELNEREARFHPRKNVLTQSLGSNAQFVKPQIGEIKAHAGDRFVLVTDGVTDGLWDRGIEEQVLDPPKKIADLTPALRLVNTAIDEGGRDNTTAMVIEVVE
ncbi:MAG: protein phosphatase 2C domain-containing protein [Planctomycetaceae bacterium]|nr:protein phosphatase 2C domain-containing protein [Planctomycetaceae bacterium]